MDIVLAISPQVALHAVTLISIRLDIDIMLELCEVVKAYPDFAWLRVDAR